MNGFHTFVDLDGVMLDFVSHFQNCTGRSVDEFRSNPDEMFRLITTIPNFWLTMPMMPGAMDLWNAIDPDKRTILSGCPRVGYDAAVSGKRRSVVEKFGPEVPVITCLSKEKVLHMIAPKDVLIDDRGYILNKWRKAGGHGVLYENAPQAIADYRRLVADLTAIAA